MNEMGPVNIVPVAVSSIDHHSSARKFRDLPRARRPAFPLRAEQPVADEIGSARSFDSRDCDLRMCGQTRAQPRARPDEPDALEITRNSASAEFALSMPPC